MTRRLKKYEVKSELDFGSFAGNSIERVFSGNHSPSIDTLRLGLLKELEQGGLGNLSEVLKVIKIENRPAFAIEINPIKTLRLSVLANQGHTFSSSSQTFWHMFSIEKKYSNFSIYDIEGVFPFVLTLGHPEYISWCLKTIEWFSLSKNAVLFMNNKSYVSKINFSSFFYDSNMYFLPHIEKSNYRFSNTDIIANSKKYQFIMH